MAIPWWQSAVVYQVYPRSFADASGDGVGDLRGLARHLDHLAWLGVDAVWLSPIFLSPMADYGYDVADYCDVDPLFGTLGDFDHLVSELHDRGMRLLLDFVPNHTSVAAPVVHREPVVDGQPQAGLVRLARPRRRTAGRPTTGSPRSRASRHGRSTRPPASTTCTASSPSNPT